MNNERLPQTVTAKLTYVSPEYAGELIARIDCLLADRVELLNSIDALRTYVQHEPMCKAYRYPGIGKCQCGLADVLERALAAIAKAEGK